MSKIIITEVDETTVQSSALSNTDIVYVPGFSMKVSQDEQVIGMAGRPVLCSTISEFETYFGSRAPVFATDQQIPSHFSDMATSNLPVGSVMFHAGEADPGYTYAKELVAKGLPVLYERVNSGIQNTDITVEKMYTYLSTNFKTSYSTSVVTKPYPQDVITVDSAVFYAAVEDAGIHTFTYVVTPVEGDEPTSSWQYGGTDIELSAYGITRTSEHELADGAIIQIYLQLVDCKLLDKGVYQFKYLTTGGYPTFEYDGRAISESMATLCAQRGDAVAFIDALDNPYRTLTGYDSVYNQAKLSTNMLAASISSYATMFVPSVEMTLINSYYGRFEGNNTKLASTKVMPASFAYLSSLASSVKTNANWLAIAGATRGKVSGLVSTRTNQLLTNAIADSYQPDNAIALNPITNINPYGECIWGNRTLVDNSIKQGTTATSFLNIRNLVSDIKKQLFIACQSLLFEQNSDVLWVNFLSLITPLLDQMKTGYGIDNYKIIRLEPSDRTKIKVKLRIYPLYAVESFDITVYINDKETYVDEDETEQ